MADEKVADAFLVTSLDAKIVQFQYAIIKLQSFSSSIRKLISFSSANPSKLPLVHYIVLLTSNLFAINEAAFMAKVQLLANYKVFKPTVIPVNTLVTHVPYDNHDQPSTILETIPTNATAIQCLKLLDYLCTNCIQGYQKKLQQAKQDKKNDSLVSEFETILTGQIFNEFDIDLSLGLTNTSNDSPFVFDLPDSELLSDANYVEASLIDMDIKAIFTITSQLQTCVNRIKPNVIKYKHLKHLTKPQQDHYLKTQPESKYALLKALMWTFRLNDLYTILRKFGRKIYLSNYQHLYDRKFAINSKASVYFKNQLLKEIDEMFNNTKKNGVLIATLTRFIRANSTHESNSKNILDFTNFVNQALVLVENTIKKLQEFGSSWILLEITFRKPYDLPTDSLIAFNNTIHTPAAPAAGTSRSKKEPTPNSKSTVSGPKTTESLKLPTGGNNLNSSNSSRTSSLSSTSSITAPNTKVMLRRSSISSSPTSNRASPMGFPSIVSKRPNSMVFSGSSDSLNTYHDAISLSPTSTPPRVPQSSASAQKTPQVTGRRRSNSQPIRGVSANLTLGTGAAAAALAKTSKISSPPASIKSPSGSIKRSSSLTRISNNVTPTKPLIRVEEKDEDTTITEESPSEKALGPVKLTANQRLQQHIRQAAKSGALMTQQKETLTLVVFDPNQPTSINLRRQAPPEPSTPTGAVTNGDEKLTTASPSSPTPSKPVRRTRDQVTKSNTMKNSVLLQIPENGSSSNGDLSRSSSASSLTVSSSLDLNSDNNSSVTKKVRFTGVPAYSPDEDAPTTYSNRILKNFAVFKSPMIHKPKLKNKDQMLKKEESLLFKQHVELPETGSPPPKNPAISAAVAMTELSKPLGGTRLSKLKNKFV